MFLAGVSSNGGRRRQESSVQRKRDFRRGIPWHGKTIEKTKGPNEWERKRARIEVRTVLRIANKACPERILKPESKNRFWGAYGRSIFANGWEGSDRRRPKTGIHRIQGDLGVFLLKEAQ